MIKKLFKKKGFLAWLITSGVLIVLLLVASLVCNLALSGLLNFAMGGPTNIYAEGSEAAYEGNYTTEEDALANANEVNLELSEEGMVLLKNDDNTLPISTPNSPEPSDESPKISIFGKSSVNIAIGGSGSGAATGEEVDLNDYLTEAGFTTNPTLQAFYNNDSLSGSGRTTDDGDLDSGDTKILSTGETPQSSYTTDVINSYSEYSDAAIVVFTRIGGEGFDLPRKMEGATGYNNVDDHFLQLDKNETELLEAVCNGPFEKVIVVLNSGSPMELAFLEDPDYYAYQEKIGAAIWMGYPGNSGTTALGEILNGTVNPSGRTVDTFSADFKKDPTWNNFGDNLITGNYDQGVQGGDQYINNGSLTSYYFVDYEEGVYVGYRYYETRGYTDGEEWYEDAVIYPFGYGLSYTTFDWKVDESTVPSTLNPEETFTVDVAVTNTGDVAGKDVVEVYMELPYYTGEIEKPYEVLIGYAKTELLEPGESSTVSVEIDPYYAASYDYKDANNNGFCGYELDSGTYTLRFNRNAHENVEEHDLTLATNYQYATDPVTGNEVVNLYTDQEDEAFNSDTQLSTVLSRTDWEGTWPDSPSDEEKNASDELIAQFADTSTNNPTDYSTEEYPMTNANNNMTLRDLLYDEDGNFVGSVDYDDERWDDLLDQMDFSEALNMFNFAAYAVNAVDSVGLPYINCSDGPVGWTSFVNASMFGDTCSYACGVIVASTWNAELVQRFGDAVGQEGLVGKDGMPYTGWYAPAMNIHRSPFGGRNFEYYSEDPLLSGKTAAAEIKGLNETGVIPFIKHFALNEQETHRSVTGDASWVTEQAMREIYLRPFEIAVKEANTMGVMTSFNRIGTRWTGGDYRLVTTILRDEWGFRGAVICDFNTIPQYMNAKQMIYAGGDLNLATLASSSWNGSESSTSDVLVLRNALKNVCYAFANSNAMKGEVIGTTLAPWQSLILYVDIGVGAAIIVSGAIITTLYLLRMKKQAEEPETQN